MRAGPLCTAGDKTTAKSAPAELLSHAPSLPADLCIHTAVISIPLRPPCSMSAPAFRMRLCSACAVDTHVLKSALDVSLLVQVLQRLTGATFAQETTS